MPPNPRLSEIARGDADLQPYVELLEAALDAAQDPIWQDAVASLTASAPGRLQGGEPALHRASVALPRSATEALVTRLRELARIPSPAAAGESAGVPSPAAAGEGQGEGSSLLPQLNRALALKAEPQGPESTVLQLTLLPLLMAAGRACAEVAACSSWLAGMCPVCAAWPALAESRGLDRARVLRCGRCGSEWTLPWQLCPFCANGDHAGLTYLTSEQTGEARRVFACDRCQGYLKTIATLAPIDPLDVPVEDLATLELDLAAVDAGRQRPSQAGFDLRLDLSWRPWAISS